jgi:hypothetical protein
MKDFVGHRYVKIKVRFLSNFLSQFFHFKNKPVKFVEYSSCFIMNAGYCYTEDLLDDLVIVVNVEVVLFSEILEVNIFSETDRRSKKLIFNTSSNPY